MEVVLKYRGREITPADVRFIQELIAAFPGSNRLALSRELCKAWEWRQTNGALRDMVCRGLMLALHRAGHITLPPPRHAVASPLTVRRRPERLTGIAETPIEMPLSLLGPLSITQVRRGPQERLLEQLIETYHYLGYTQPVGEHLKYMVKAGERPVACLSWCSAVRHLASRDRYIGWSPEIRRKNLHLIAYNTRYLIMPWVRVPHLASHLLGHFARRLPGDWEALYNHPVHFLETFINPELYAGTCYRAANWISLGLTTGRGKNDKTMKANRPIKEVLAYPLSKNFRDVLLA